MIRSGRKDDLWGQFFAIRGTHDSAAYIRTLRPPNSFLQHSPNERLPYTTTSASSFSHISESSNVWREFGYHFTTEGRKEANVHTFRFHYQHRNTAPSSSDQTTSSDIPPPSNPVKHSYPEPGLQPQHVGEHYSVSGRTYQRRIVSVDPNQSDVVAAYRNPGYEFKPGDDPFQIQSNEEEKKAWGSFRVTKAEISDRAGYNNVRNRVSQIDFYHNTEPIHLIIIIE